MKAGILDDRNQNVDQFLTDDGRNWWRSTPELMAVKRRTEHPTHPTALSSQPTTAWQIVRSSQWRREFEGRIVWLNNGKKTISIALKGSSLRAPETRLEGDSRQDWLEGGEIHLTLIKIACLSNNDTKDLLSASQRSIVKNASSDGGRINDDATKNSTINGNGASQNREIKLYNT